MHGGLYGNPCCHGATVDPVTILLWCMQREVQALYWHNMLAGHQWPQVIVNASCAMLSEKWGETVNHAYLGECVVRPLVLVLWSPPLHMSSSGHATAACSLQLKERVQTGACRRCSCCDVTHLQRLRLNEFIACLALGQEAMRLADHQKTTIVAAYHKWQQQTAAAQHRSAHILPGMWALQSRGQVRCCVPEQGNPMGMTGWTNGSTVHACASPILMHQEVHVATQPCRGST